MSGHGNRQPIPFQPPAGAQLVGQPFTIVNFRVPMDMQLQCNCTPDKDRPVLTITSSTAVACPTCRKLYNAVFNPQTKNIEMQIGVPSAEETKVPS